MIMQREQEIGGKKILTLNRTNYPLVVGSEDKITFRNWENSGSSVELKASVNHDLYSESDVSWYVENPEIVQIEIGQDNSCIAKGRTTGWTKVFAVLPNGEKASCFLTVIDNITRTTIRSLSLNVDSLVLKPGMTAKLFPIILPKDIFRDTVFGDNSNLTAKTMNSNLRWISSDERIVKVQDGHLTAERVGTANITVVSEDVDRKAVCHVEVVRECQFNYLENTEERCMAVIDLEVGDTMQLSRRGRESDGENGTEELQYASDNPFVVSVDEKGKLYAHSNSKIQRVSEDHLSVWEEYGTVDVYETTRDGRIYRYPVRVHEKEQKAEEIAFHCFHENLVIGCEYRVTAVVTPASALHRKVTFFSSDEEIFSISSVEKTVDGLNCAVILGKREGKAILTAECDGKKANCLIQVIEHRKKVSKVEIQEVVSLEVEGVLQLIPRCDVDYADTKFSWISTNQDIITVSKEGWVKGYSIGEAKIYAIVTDDLVKEDIECIHFLEECCNIEADILAKQLLERLLHKNPYSVSKVHVDKGSRVLYNLHIPSETITENSFVLLWNRDSLFWTKELDYYEISSEGKCIQTKQLSYTLHNLKPATEYEVEVRAIDGKGNSIAYQRISCCTKKSGTWINVMHAPYNAKGDGSVTDTFAIQKAINECPEGEVVYLPENHIFCTGALFLKSYMTLQVDGILMGTQDPKDYPMIVSRWEGWRKLPQSETEWKNSTKMLPYNNYVHASLLNLGVYDEGKPSSYGPYNIEEVVIRGKGQINGDGFRLGYNEGPNRYEAGGGIPVPFSPIVNPTMRGSLIRMHNAKNVYVADVTLAYGPGWQVHPIYSTQVTFNHLELISKGNGVTGCADNIGILNGDGIDPDSCSHINIVDCYFYVNDDSVTLKSGRNKEGNELDKPDAYIRVTDCITQGSKAGFVIGSEDASGCHDILMQNLLVKDVAICGLWLKTMRPRGGKNTDIQYKDIVIDGSGIPIRIASEYASMNTSAANVNPAMEVPDIGHILFENIKDTGKNDHGMQFVGLKESELHDFIFRGVSAKENGCLHQFVHCKNFCFDECEF